MLSFSKFKFESYYKRERRLRASGARRGAATLERARQGDSRPPAVEVSPPARGSGVDQTSPVPGARCGAGERDNRGVFAVLQLARSAHQRVLHFVQSPLSLVPSRSHSLLASSRLAAPAAVLLPADDFNVRSQRPPEHKSFYGNFIPNAPRSLAHSGTSI